MIQLILHLFGDYVTQSDWMAQGKTKRTWPAFVHATVYSLPFILLTRHWQALFIIWSTHLLIDRFRLARYVVWAKNILLGVAWLSWGDLAGWDWDSCKETGYHKDVPPWMAVWLLIAADNTIHLAINYAALRWL